MYPYAANSTVISVGLKLFNLIYLFETKSRMSNPGRDPWIEGHTP